MRAKPDSLKGGSGRTPKLWAEFGKRGFRTDTQALGRIRKKGVPVGHPGFGPDTQALGRIRGVSVGHPSFGPNSEKGGSGRTPKLSAGCRNRGQVLALLRQT